jgi:uncharacterized protein YodC (DUF2158 family)
MIDGEIINVDWFVGEETRRDAFHQNQLTPYLEPK